jgi:ribonuclease P protein component
MTTTMSHPKNNFPLKRLKSKTAIDLLFDKGKIIRSKHLMLKYETSGTYSSFYAGVSVSKRNFKRAVDRNRIKRRLREGLKQTEPHHYFSGNCMLIYTSRKKIDTSILIQEIKILLAKV